MPKEGSASLPYLNGPLYSYLGHFSNEPVIKSGHNVISREGNHFILKAKKSGKVLGRGSKKQMKTRERQVNYFKKKSAPY